MRLVADPTEAPVAAVVRAVGDGARVALVHATAYTDDRQVMVHLARALGERGLTTGLLDPTRVLWHEGQCPRGDELVQRPHRHPAALLPGRVAAEHARRLRLALVLRGQPHTDLQPGRGDPGAEQALPAGLGSAGGRPSHLARAAAGDALAARCGLARRRRLDPEALGRVGEDIGLRGVVEAREWKGIARAARWWPARWVAQRRFEALALEHDGEPLYPCLGVYVIDGQAAGIYGRVARRPLIDSRSRDVPVLMSSGAT
jgi:hypothetical protein